MCGVSFAIVKKTQQGKKRDLGLHSERHGFNTWPPNKSYVLSQEKQQANKQGRVWDGSAGTCFMPWQAEYSVHGQITAYSAAHHAATSAIMDWTARKYARWEHTKESDAGATRTCGRQKWDAENLWPCGRALGQAPLTQTQPSVCHVT